MSSLLPTVPGGGSEATGLGRIQDSGTGFCLPSDTSEFQRKQAVEAMRGSDAPSGTLRRFGDRTRNTCLFLEAAKNLLTLKSEISSNGNDSERIFEDLEKTIYADFEAGLYACWKKGYHFGFMKQEVNQQLYHMYCELMKQNSELVQQNSELKLKYDEAMEFQNLINGREDLELLSHLDVGDLMNTDELVQLF